MSPMRLAAPAGNGGGGGGGPRRFVSPVAIGMDADADDEGSSGDCGGDADTSAVTLEGGVRAPGTGSLLPPLASAEPGGGGGGGGGAHEMHVLVEDGETFELPAIAPAAAAARGGGGALADELVPRPRIPRTPAVALLSHEMDGE